MDDTTAGLIELVKEKETIPDSGAAYSDSVLLNYLDQSMKAFIVPAIESTIEGHFVVTLDVQMAVQPSYPNTAPPKDVDNSITIPGESAGLRLYDVYIIGNDGAPYNIPRLTPTQAAAQSSGGYYGNGFTGALNNQFIGGFFLQGNQLFIYPYGLASGKLVRLLYQRMPADLCLTSEAGQVINVTGDVVTINTVQSNWFGNITHVNAIQKALPHEYVKNPLVPVTVYTSYTPLDDILLVNVAGNVLTLPAGLATNIQVGDWICPAGFSVFAQNIPKDVLPALIQKAACMCIHAAGDAGGYKMAETEFKEMLASAMKLIAPRVIGKPVKLLSTNSPFKASRGSNWGRW